jgi:hypothetical protein
MTAPVMRPLGEALLAGAFEMAELASLADDVQAAIGALCAGAAALTPGLMADCQAADLLSQRIAGMSRFLAVMALAAPDAAHVDVGPLAHKLTLADQAARLSGLPEPDGDEGEAGDLEVFDG